MTGARFSAHPFMAWSPMLGVPLTVIGLRVDSLEVTGIGAMVTTVAAAVLALRMDRNDSEDQTTAPEAKARVAWIEGDRRPARRPRAVGVPVEDAQRTPTARLEGVRKPGVVEAHDSLLGSDDRKTICPATRWYHRADEETESVYSAVCKDCEVGLTWVGPDFAIWAAVS